MHAAVRTFEKEIEERVEERVRDLEHDLARSRMGNDVLRKRLLEEIERVCELEAEVEHLKSKHV